MTTAPPSTRRTKPEATENTSRRATFLSRAEYAACMRMYMTMTMPKGIARANAVASPVSTRMTAAAVANRGERAPEAMGLFRLVGWARSRSLSARSLMR